MKCAIGVDLGSTTTKAVVLDESGRMLGRGITNSRNNYDAACALARAEAMIDARFTMARRALHEIAGGAQPEFLDRLERAFRLEQHAGQLRLLRQTTRKEAEMLTARGSGGDAGGVADKILSRMEEEAPALFTPGARRRSDFFRDIAASEYLRLAEGISRESKVPFDRLSGLFDKAILKVENTPLDLSFQTHIGPALDRTLASPPGDAGPRPDQCRAAVQRAAAADLDDGNCVGTGYGRARLPFPRERIRSEILCHGLGAHALFERTATVLDIGGQDTKAIQVDGDGIVTSFQMNDRCAAGCGRYLGYIADEMNLGVHELGPLAEASQRPVKISSTCTVFAGAEIRDRLTLGQKREDILAGLHRAIILRAMALLARSGGIRDEFTFTGGVAKNRAAVSALGGLVRDNYGEIRMNISPDSIFTGALGAALFALRGADNPGPAAASSSISGGS